MPIRTRSSAIILVLLLLAAWIPSPPQTRAIAGPRHAVATDRRWSRQPDRRSHGQPTVTAAGLDRSARRATDAGPHASDPTPGIETARLPPPTVEPPSVHAEMLAAHAGDVLAFDEGGHADGAIGHRRRPRPNHRCRRRHRGLPNGLRREVFGYLPYWMLTDRPCGLPRLLRWSRPSPTSSVDARPDGNLAKADEQRRRPPAGPAGRLGGHDAMSSTARTPTGVKVVLTVTMMAWSGNYSAMTDPARTAPRTARQPGWWTIAAAVAAAQRRRREPRLRADAEQPARRVHRRSFDR